MYFDTNEVNDILLCQQCEGRLDIPKILPCGETICSVCEISIQLNGQMFNCLICKENHEMPKNGFLISKALSKMLAIKLTKVSRGLAFDKLKKSLDEIQKKRNFIKLAIENSSDFVKEYCIDLRSDVQLTGEECILQINDFITKLIEEIDEYEKEIIELNKTNSKSLDGFNSILKELDSFHAVNTEYLKQHLVDDNKLNKSIEDATDLINKVESDIKDLKSVIFNGKPLLFERSNQKINKSILGLVKITDSKINSFIFPGKNQMKDLMNLCEFPLNQEWDLIYRASQDGFEAAKFHSKCDKKPNTLVVIKSTNGNIFGGYTEQSWSEDAFFHYKADPESFIFSFINLDNKPLKIKWSRNEGIYCYGSIGPAFGGGPTTGINHDIRIEKSDGWSNLGHSYTHPDYIEDSFKAKSLLAGSRNFQVSEIEVFTKL